RRSLPGVCPPTGPRRPAGGRPPARPVPQLRQRDVVSSGRRLPQAAARTAGAAAGRGRRPGRPGGRRGVRPPVRGELVRRTAGPGLVGARRGRSRDRPAVLRRAPIPGRPPRAAVPPTGRGADRPTGPAVHGRRSPTDLAPGPGEVCRAAAGRSGPLAGTPR